MIWSIIPINIFIDKENESLLTNNRLLRYPTYSHIMD